MNKVFPLLIFVALSLAAGESRAERTGAQLGAGEDSLPRRIEFPELKGDTTAIVRCAARVEGSGKMKDNGCAAGTPADQVFIDPINKAAKKARLSPAMADDREKEVYFQYRVEFISKGDERTVNVYPNPGVQENVDAYGADHVAAQRAVGKEEWQDVCPGNAQYLVWLKAHVAEDGTPSNFSLTHGGGLNPSPRCQQAILGAAEASLYFPALADGEPVPSTYVEPYGN
ncbi:MAG: hypothetical protein WD795_05050 [Woeseia sp.]